MVIRLMVSLAGEVEEQGQSLVLMKDHFIDYRGEQWKLPTGSYTVSVFPIPVYAELTTEPGT